MARRMCCMVLMVLLGFSVFSWDWQERYRSAIEPWYPGDTNNGFSPPKLILQTNNFSILEHGLVLFRSDRALYGKTRAGMLPEKGDWVSILQPGGFVTEYRTDGGGIDLPPFSMEVQAGQKLGITSPVTEEASLSILFFDTEKRRVLNPQAVQPLYMDSHGLGIERAILVSDRGQDESQRLIGWRTAQVPFGSGVFQAVLRGGRSGIQSVSVSLDGEVISASEYDYLMESGDESITTGIPGFSGALEVLNSQGDSMLFRYSTRIEIPRGVSTVSLAVTDYSGISYSISYPLIGR
ncbi:hypothetical protein [Spirochaeta lutea]|nr:hypothetical protein [Spirochaeta lutea]